MGAGPAAETGNGAPTYSQTTMARIPPQPRIHLEAALWPDTLDPIS